MFDLALIESPLQRELENDEDLKSYRNDQMKVLGPLYGFTDDQDQIVEWNAALESLGVQISPPQMGVLMETYHRVSQYLTSRHFDVVVPTYSEINLKRRIRAETRLEFWSSAWIGPYCTDIFFPAIGGQAGVKPRTKGLVIEVNGNIHNQEIKSKKDSSRLDYLNGMEILVCEIENDDFNSPTVNALISQLKYLPRISSLDRLQLKQRIAVETIATHASDKELRNLFGESFFPIRNYITGGGSFR